MNEIYNNANITTCYSSLVFWLSSSEPYHSQVFHEYQYVKFSHR